MYRYLDASVRLYNGTSTAMNNMASAGNLLAANRTLFFRNNDKVKRTSPIKKMIITVRKLVLLPEENTKNTKKELMIIFTIKDKSLPRLDLVTMIFSISPSSNEKNKVNTVAETLPREFGFSKMPL
jgi:hypothetical protein